MTIPNTFFPKRFIAFRCEPYYPLGGMRDAIGSFDTLNEAREAHKEVDHILDRDTGDVIEVD